MSFFEGFKDSFTNGLYSSITKTATSNFGSTGENNVTNNYYYLEESSDSDNNEEIDDSVYIFGFTVALIIQLVLFIIGWVLVGKIAPGDNSKQRNTRLILYIFLIFTGGTMSLFYIALWYLHLNIT